MSCRTYLVKLCRLVSSLHFSKVTPTVSAFMGQKNNNKKLILQRYNVAVRTTAASSRTAICGRRSDSP